MGEGRWPYRIKFPKPRTEEQQAGFEQQSVQSWDAGRAVREVGEWVELHWKNRLVGAQENGASWKPC